MSQDPTGVLEFSPPQREALWKFLIGRLEAYRANVSYKPVRQKRTPAQVLSHIETLPLGPAHSPEDILEFVVSGMEEFNLHTAHPKYFGVFNPHPSFLGMMGDLLASSYNPQLASSASAAWPIAIEQKVIAWLGAQMTWRPAEFEGHLCNGGTESNLTALVTCLHSRFPNFKNDGVAGLRDRPMIYVSEEAHHSFYRAVQTCGLGRQSIREVKVDATLKMDLHELEAMIAEDRKRGFLPLMIVGSAGTTNAGVVDPLNEIAALALSEGAWFHVDAAWGGAAMILPEMKALFLGIEQAQSITLDLHKWFSVPFSAGVFLCRVIGASAGAFGLPRSPYMTKQKDPASEPFETSLQWSRRFLGLKFYMTLLGAGTEGYQAVLRKQIRLGGILRDQLSASGWTLCNQTPLPVVCFTHPTFQKNIKLLPELLLQMQDSGDFWLTSTQLSGDLIPVLRAGIPSFSSTEKDTQALVARLDLLLKSLG